MKTLILACLIKIAILFLVAILAIKIVPYKGFFPYRDQLIATNLPAFIYSFANFDGLHYLTIAKEGYHQYQQAFFPLYPLLIRILSGIFFNNYLLTGLIISNLSFLIGLLFFYKLIPLVKKNVSPFWTLAFLLFFPTAFFFSAVYTEGLFFMLTTGALFFLGKKQYLRAGLLAAGASATRLMGLFLFIPFLSLLYQGKMKRKILFALFPFTGLGMYMFYLFLTTGDPFFFFHAQPAFGANRSTNLILLPQVYFRYLKIFFSASFNFQYVIALTEFVFFTEVFLICIADFFKHVKTKNWFYLSLIIFSFVLLLLPTLTGTFSSMPRYALLALSLYFYLAELKNTALKTMLLIFFALGQLVLFSLFIQGYFIS